MLKIAVCDDNESFLETLKKNFRECNKLFLRYKCSMFQ